MGENQGMMWIVIAGLAVVAGTYQLSISSKDSLSHSTEQVKVRVDEVFKEAEK